MAASFIPRKDEDFHNWAANLIGVLADKASDYGVPAGLVTSVTAAFGAWSEAWEAYLRPNHGKGDTVTKQEARKALETQIRGLVKSYLINNPGITDAEFIDMGLPVHDKNPTPRGDPVTTPELSRFDSSVIRRLGVHYKDTGSERRGKPGGVHGAEFRWAVLDQAAQSIEELANFTADTASPCVFDFTDAERGRSFCFVMRWVNNSKTNTKGFGPWSEIYWTKIP
ncbi:hypothetical protein FACS189468_8890 [Spirochaetia bacterium]|nr:hypothetical protein FACS189468_8890 [Spirochaetia bacterium]